MFRVLCVERALGASSSEKAFKLAQAGGGESGDGGAVARSIAAQNGDAVGLAQGQQPPPSLSQPSASPIVAHIVHRQPDQQEHEIIPGVEHKFFEEELEKMEHQSGDAAGIVVLAVDCSPHSDFAFECEYLCTFQVLSMLCTINVSIQFIPGSFPLNSLG